MSDEKKWEIINYRKERSIAWFNSTNNAVAMAGILETTGDWATIRLDMAKWRDWFILEWDKENPAPKEDDITYNKEVKDF